MHSTLSKRMTPSQGVRTFVAVEIPAASREVLSGVIASFEPERHLLKLVAPGLLHITLRFLGSVPTERLAAVETAARVAAECIQPFTLTVRGLGGFPSERAPRVLWAGVDGEGLESLHRLARGVNDALASEGFAPDIRGFSPHVTLARAKDGLSAPERRGVADALHRVQAVGVMSEPFPVRDLVVMRSDPGPAGPRYTPLVTVPLQAAG